MFCYKCGSEIPEESRFCPNCAAEMNFLDTETEDKEFLDNTHRFLRYERVPWKAFGIFFLIFGGIYGVIALFMGLVFMITMEDVFLGLLMGFLYMLVASMFLAIGYVNIKMVSKVDFYLERVYTEPKTVFDRTGSVGMIVFCAFFNTVAMAFYIVNFVRTKNSQKIIERINRKFGK